MFQLTYNYLDQHNHSLTRDPFILEPYQDADLVLRKPLNLRKLIAVSSCMLDRTKY
jgi:hypothetical protein